ncbi:hypothetical protein G5714_004083 [Onychostoma macrolepis]|uniref:Uncharacterized protein n=1 Tax=Onychostoma macrolepis TaxID=369639 RepID=A0A7J6DCJ0_9TELE|nr:hypothetical protein G5714_004083 [Onychostoma macrolepis]
MAVCPSLSSLSTDGLIKKLIEAGIQVTEEETRKFRDEKCYTALVLTHLLPPLPGSRCTVKCAISFLLDFVLAGTSIASLCSNSETSKTQPQLICIGSLEYYMTIHNHREK